MSLVIRKAGPKDLMSLCNLMSELSGHIMTPVQMTNRLRFFEESNVDHRFFVCEENDKILGLLGFRIRENIEETTKYGEVSAIVVNTEDRNKGVGKFMMEYAEKLALELGCIGTWLTSGFGREEPAHDFYRRLGYQINRYRFVKLNGSTQ